MLLHASIAMPLLLIAPRPCLAEMKLLSKSSCMGCAVAHASQPGRRETFTARRITAAELEVANRLARRRQIEDSAMKTVCDQFGRFCSVNSLNIWSEQSIRWFSASLRIQIGIGSVHTKMRSLRKYYRRLPQQDRHAAVALNTACKHAKEDAALLPANAQAEDLSTAECLALARGVGDERTQLVALLQLECGRRADAFAWWNRQSVFVEPLRMRVVVDHRFDKGLRTRSARKRRTYHIKYLSQRQLRRLKELLDTEDYPFKDVNSTTLRNELRRGTDRRVSSATLRRNFIHRIMKASKKPGSSQVNFTEVTFHTLHARTQTLEGAYLPQIPDWHLDNV